MANKVITGKVRASFVHVFEPQSINGSEPKYSCSLIIPKSDTDTVGKIREAIEKAKQEGVPKWGGKIPPNLKLPLRDGDIDRPDDEAYANSYFINASSREQPGVVDRRRVPMVVPSRHSVSPFMIFISRHERAKTTNILLSSFRCAMRKSAMVRKSGCSRFSRNHSSTFRPHSRMRFREERILFM